MRIDTYTKAVLTIIPTALVWIAARGADVLPGVEAQDRMPTRVVVVGWEEGGPGFGARSLPLPVREQPDNARPTNTRVVVASWVDRAGLTHQLPAPRVPESAREFGIGVPVTADAAR